jgi:hypothetical protein
MTTLQHYLKSTSSLNVNFYPRLLLCFLIACIAYLVFPFFVAEPAGLHFTRQTDSLSFVYGYLIHDLNLFAPSTLNLSSTGGKAACEFPILYWIAALISKTGLSPTNTLKTIHLSISLIGVVYLFSTFRLLLHNVWLAFGGSALVVSSTIWLYYASSSLPDAPAIGLSFIGIFYSVKTLLDTNDKYLKKALIFLAFASLIKITYAIFLIALPMTFVLSRKYSFSKITLWTILSVTPTVLWALYSNYYNAINNSNYFLTTWVPIWTLSAQEIYLVFDYLSRYWRSNFYYQTTQHVFVFACVMLGFSFRKLNRPLLNYTLITLMGGLFYMLLFFDKFKDHDYYLLVFIPSFSLLFLSFLSLLEKLFTKAMWKWTAIIAILTLAVLSNNYAHYKLSQRFNHDSDRYSVVHDRLIGFDKTSFSSIKNHENKVLVIGDHTMNGSLALLGLEGITIPGSKLNSVELKKILYQEKITKAIVLDSLYIPEGLFNEGPDFEIIHVVPG